MSDLKSYLLKRKSELEKEITPLIKLLKNLEELEKLLKEIE